MENVIDLMFDKKLSPKLAELFSMLTETRKRLFEEIEGLTQEQLDFTPALTKIETIGTLLFHICAVEFSWIYEDIFHEEMIYEEWKYAFALRETLSPPQLTEQPLSFYIQKLTNLRARLYNTLCKMNDEDLKKVIHSGKNNYTIYWILYHLNQHESVHIGQINFLKRLYQILNSPQVTHKK